MWVLALALAGPGIGARAGAASAAEARAQDDSREAELRRARQHFEDGRKAFEARDYLAALREFRAGYEIEPRPGFLLNMGHATQKLGDLSGARDLYKRFLLTNPTGEERRVAEESIAEIDRKQALGSGAVVAPPVGATPGAGAQPVDGAPPATAPPATSPGAPGATGPGVGGAATRTPRSSSSPAGSASLPDIAPQPSDPSMLTAPAPSTSNDQPPEGSPLYTKWWLWTGVGLVAVGVAAFLVFGAKGSNNSHDSGSWGQIKL